MPSEKEKTEVGSNEPTLTIEVIGRVSIDSAAPRKDLPSMASQYVPMDMELLIAVGRTTLKAGAEPLAIPVGVAGLVAFGPRLCSVLLDAICSRENVLGSERRTSNE